MPSIKEFVASNTYRPEDKGYSAFETLGRRVGGQFDQAGNDIRDIGRAQAAATNMIGRWPFNIIELEQRAAKEAATVLRGQGAAPGKGRGGFSIQGPGRGGYGGSRRSPNYSSFDQMSEGAGSLGRMLHTEGSSTRSDRDGYSAQALREKDRWQQLYNAAQRKQWDSWNKELNDYNKKVNADAADAADNIHGPTGVSGNPSSPYYDERQTGGDFGGGGDPFQQTYGKYSSDGSYIGETSVDPSTSTWSRVTNGLSSLFGGSSSNSVAEADIPDFNPNY